MMTQSRYGGATIGHYVTLIRYTQGSGQNQGKPGAPGRRPQGRRESRWQDSRLVLDYGKVRKYDAVIVSEFPNDEASAKFMLATGAAGNVTTQTMKAFTEDEYRKIIASL
jgi:uncharacterized protein with GYD domain